MVASCYKIPTVTLFVGLVVHVHLPAKLGVAKIVGLHQAVLVEVVVLQVVFLLIPGV